MDFRTAIAVAVVAIVVAVISLNRTEHVLQGICQRNRKKIRPELVK